MHISSPFALFAIVLFITGCAPRGFDKKVHYVTRILIVDMDQKGKNGKPPLELKKERINLCLLDQANSPHCFKNLHSGSIIDAATISRSLALSSIERLGKEPTQYAFPLAEAPRIQATDSTDIIYMGMLMINISTNDKKSGIGLFSSCKHEDKMLDVMIRSKKVSPKASLASHCFDLGTVIRIEGTPITLMPIIPRVEP